MRAWMCLYPSKTNIKIVHVEITTDIIIYLGLLVVFTKVFCALIFSGDENIVNLSFQISNWIKIEVYVTEECTCNIWNQCIELFSRKEGVIYEAGWSRLHSAASIGTPSLLI